MLTHDVNSSCLKNKGFSHLHKLFQENGWVLLKNEENWINYTKTGDESSYFDIKITKDKIVVCVPIKNSAFQYVTSFTNYYDALEYIESKFFDYNN